MSATSMTMTEKILARAAGKPSVEPGDNVWVNADILMTHDVCGPGTIGIFKREFGRQAKVWDRDRVVLIPDHYIFTADEKAHRNVDILREFAGEQHLPHLYDVEDAALQRRLPHRARRGRPHASGRGTLRHRLPHLHGRRLQRVRDRHRQHRRGVRHGHGQAPR